MEVSATTWNTLSKLLDEALDLEPAARDTWLEQLSAAQPQLAPSVRKLLAAHASSETADVLAQLPELPMRSDTTRIDALSPGDRVGPYRLKRELGSGGMGDVWLAERADGAFTREVALKLPLINRLRRDLAQRFARERDILARLEHPHIARLYDAGVTNDGLPYLAMEYVDGRAITEYCDAKRLDIEARLKLFLQVLDAVQFAHANLIIHRDIKPSNILVTADGDVRLLDFGIAKLLAQDDTARETQLTQLSGRALTPDYASPEQIKGEPLTIVTDVYSLGVVLYEVLSGNRPYRLKLQSPAQLEQAIVNAEPARPSSEATEGAAIARATTRERLVKSLSGDLDTIVLKALSKSGVGRYSTASEFAQDLQNHLAGLPVRAQPASWAYRARKFVMRNRLPVIAASAISAVLIAATLISVWQANVAKDEAARAEEVKQFVLSLFYSADTGKGGTQKTTAAELLATAYERLAKSDIANPATKVELLTSIGFSLIGLGEYQQAVPLLEEAVRLAAAALRSEHPSAAAAQLALGEALMETSQFRQAEPHLDAAERALRRSGDVAELVNALRWKANLRVTQSRYDEAVGYASEAVHLAESTLLATRKRLVMLANQTLANTLMSASRIGRTPPARRAYELAQEMSSGRLTTDLLNTRSLYAYAMVLESDGDPRQGLQELEALLPQQIELLGPRHSDVQRTLGRIANASITMGDPLAAIDSIRHALSIELELSPDRPTADAGLFYSRLGAALANARRYEEAEQELRRAINAFAATPGSYQSEQHLVQSILGFVLTQMGRLAEADDLFSQLLSRPPSTPSVQAITKFRIGILRSAQQRYAESIVFYRDAADFFSGSGRLFNHAQVLSALGAAQLENGQPAEALITLLRAESILKKLQPQISPDQADLLVTLGRVHLALNRTDEAVNASTQAVDFWRSFDARNRHTGVALLWHARTLAAASQKSEAAGALRQASEILSTAGLKGDRALLDQVQRELRG